MLCPPAFLYQEYRDTSKQQEIEQRRQQENLCPEVTSGSGAAGSGVASPPTIQLQLRNNARSLSLWQNLEAVLSSGLLMELPQKEVIMQEVGGATATGSDADEMSFEPPPSTSCDSGSTFRLLLFFVGHV